MKERYNVAPWNDGKDAVCKAEDGKYILYTDHLAEIREIVDTYDLLIDRCDKKNSELEDERDGYRNGQQQVQDLLAKQIDNSLKLAAENKRLCKRIAELEAENHRLIVQRDGAFERWKSAIAKYPNGADGCCCLFDDNENQVQWCTPHAELRDENDALTAERDKLKARVAELEAEMRER